VQIIRFALLMGCGALALLAGIAPSQADNRAALVTSEEEAEAASTVGQKSDDQPVEEPKVPPPRIEDVRHFDGPWTATLVCESTSSGLPGWRYEFAGEVTKGIFHGQRGAAGKPGSERFDGMIEANGTANIVQVGLSGDSSKDPFHRPEGTEFRNRYAGSFDGSRGKLIRLNRTSCSIDLSKRTEAQHLVKGHGVTPSRGAAIAQQKAPCEDLCIKGCSLRATGGSSQTTCMTGCIPRCHMSRAGMQ
jgi:hypothetical protein